MAYYLGVDDGNLPQGVKDVNDEYARKIFVFFNNSFYRFALSNGRVDPEASQIAEDRGYESMNGYISTGIISVLGLSQGT